MAVFRIGDGQRWGWGVAIAPVYRRTEPVNVKTQPEHGVRLVELNVFRQNRALFPRDTHTKVQIVREVRLVWQAVVEKV